jgi:hypothetical protein
MFLHIVSHNLLWLLKIDKMVSWSGILFGCEKKLFFPSFFWGGGGGGGQYGKQIWEGVIG